jgi:hypothetical protein
MRIFALIPIAMALTLGGAAAAESPRLDEGASGAPRDKGAFLARFEARFKRLDRNGDGAIGKDEWTAARKGGKAERADRVFALIDRDGDGKLTPPEWRAAGERVYERRLARRNDRATETSPPPAAGESKPNPAP